jgi:hypothetical protein
VVSTPPVPPGRRDPDDLEPDPTGIRALLGALPDPGPMPPDLVDRINASIAAEQSAREDPTVVPLRPSRRWGWRQVGAVAAAVAVVGVGVPTLLSSLGPGGVVASLSGGSTAEQEAAGSGDDSAGGQQPAAPNAAPTVTSRHSLGDRASAAVGAVTMAATGTAYTRSSLVTQADRVQGTALDARDHASKGTGAAAESEAGLRACLTAVGVEAWMPVWGDVASLDGRPAVVAVVTGDTGRLVYAVAPACDATHPDVLAGPLPLP